MKDPKATAFAVDAPAPSTAVEGALTGSDLFLGRRLVVFDVDGTLYDQSRLRRAMAARLLAEAARRRSVEHIRILSCFRRVREELAAAETEGFEPALFARVAALTGAPEARVRELASEWMDKRPLPLLARCAYPGVERLFAALRRRGIAIGVLSDYPARDKLRAMGLAADFIVAATDPEVGAQKPHPKGLQRLLALVGCTPEEAILIGDRADRDGAVAARVGVTFLMRSRRTVTGATVFHSYSDDPFVPVLDGAH